MTNHEALYLWLSECRAYYKGQISILKKHPIINRHKIANLEWYIEILDMMKAKR